MIVSLRFLSLMFFTCLLLLACNGNKKELPVSTMKPGIVEYPDHVGDIAPDPDLDDPAFETCRKTRIPQYYALGADYRVPNKQLMDHFGTIDLSHSTETGYFTIRFLVNCKGKIGRLREQSMTTEYEKMTFGTELKDAIRNRLQAFDQWPEGRDFYQYLTFKIEQGKIREVLP